MEWATPWSPMGMPNHTSKTNPRNPLLPFIWDQSFHPTQDRGIDPLPSVISRKQWAQQRNINLLTRHDWINRERASIHIQNYQQAASQYYESEIIKCTFDLKDLVLRKVFKNTREEVTANWVQYEKALSK